MITQGLFYERAGDRSMRYTGPGDLLQYFRWSQSDDAGISSRTIVHALTGAEVLHPYHASPPLDAGDFGRCVRMLDLFPWLRDGLHQLPALHANWPAALSREWPALEALYVLELSEGTNRAPKLNARLQELVPW